MAGKNHPETGLGQEGLGPKTVHLEKFRDFHELL
jgi:hypothetical protein